MNDYLIDDILPRGEVNLLGGPSGAGKTRWLLRQLYNWQEGDKILGHLCHPVPWVYVASDRSRKSVQRTLGGMGIDHAKIPTIWAWDEGLKWHQILDRLEKRQEPLVVVESFGSFVESPATGRLVKDHLNTTARNLQASGKTVIGVVESPKMKPYERYNNPRQRISGVAAWSHFSETIILIEPSDLKDEISPLRHLYVCPRNGPAQLHMMAFNDQGELVNNMVAHY